MALIHSLGTDRRIWHHQAEVLAATYRVLCPDVRGHGMSGHTGAASTTRDWAADLVRVLDDAAVSRAALVGLSLGGVVTLQALLDHPDRVSAAILADTFAELKPEVAADRIENMVGRAEAEGMTAFGRSYADETLLEAGEADRRLVAEAIAGMPLAAYSDAARTCFSVRLSDRLGEVRPPTLVVWGDRDVKTPRPLAEQLVTGIRGSRLALISGAGHLSNLDKPDSFTAAVAAFLHETASEAA